MDKKLLVLVLFVIILVGGVYLLKSANVGTGILWQLSNGGKFLLPLVTAGALIDSLHVCALSILILTVAFLLSLGRLRSDILKLGFLYIAGIFLVYIMIGLGLLRAFHFFNVPNFMGKLGAAVMAILGILTLAPILFPGFPVKLKIPKASHRAIATLMERGSASAVFLLGGLVGLCAFPCTGGPYLMVLGLLHDNATFWEGLGYLVYYNLLFVLPLVILLFIAGNKAVLEKIEFWQKQESKTLHAVSGLAMVVLGMLILLFF